MNILNAVPPPPLEVDTLARLEHWSTAALEHFLLMMWTEMQQVQVTVRTSVGTDQLSDS